LTLQRDGNVNPAVVEVLHHRTRGDVVWSNQSFAKLELIHPELIHRQISPICAQYRLNMLFPIGPQRAVLEYGVVDRLNSLKPVTENNRI
jgi:hypothetical protein